MMAPGLLTMWSQIIRNPPLSKVTSPSLRLAVSPSGGLEPSNLTRTCLHTSSGPLASNEWWLRDFPENAQFLGIFFSALFILAQ